MAKFNESAEKYAKPHTMSGGNVNVKEAISVSKDPNTMAAKDIKPGKPAMRVSMGDPGADDVKRDGIETRGNGAATKGRIARGPMA